VPERCSCGAQLPPDALFCHKCGKPQREILAPEEVVEAPPPLPTVTAPAAPPPIGFHNGTAVRIALLAGVLSILVSGVAGQFAVPKVALLCLVATGFLAVFLYRRQTGQRLSALSGARLGWISGIFGFVIATVLLTVIATAMSDPNVVATMREQLRQRGRPDADLNQMIEALHNPSTLVGVLLMSFVLFTVLPAFGGAVGAKLLDRD
jgi:hypothetical protein